MLCLHCGWPRTGTSSLQAALAGRRESLAAASIVYPDAWGPGPGHNGIRRLLVAAAGSDGQRSAFIQALASDPDRHHLLSAEAVANWVRSDRERVGLLDLLRAAKDVTGVRCIWVLRRFDEFLGSLYLLQLLWGRDLPEPMEYFEHTRIPDALFAGMVELGAAPGIGSAYVRYSSGGGHMKEVLDAAGVPDRVAASVLDEVERGPRRFPSLSQKEAAVLCNVQAVSARAGTDLDRARLYQAFSQGFRFDRDRPCELVDAATKRRAHERALSSARTHGHDAYTGFFGDAEVGSSRVTPLAADVVTDEDLAKLVGHLARRMPD